MDFGSKRPLNWSQPQLPQSTMPIVGRHPEQMSPPTRQGSYAGQPSQLTAPKDAGPDLFLDDPNKKNSKDDLIGDLVDPQTATTDMFGDIIQDPNMTAAQGLSSQSARVVDPGSTPAIANLNSAAPLMHGAVPVTPTGQVTPGQQEQLDATKQGIGPRGAKFTITTGGHLHYPTHKNGQQDLSQVGYHKSYTDAINILKNFGTTQVPKQQMGSPQVPGMNAAPAMNMTQQQQNTETEQPIGFTPSGMPIHTDPFHAAHKDFSKEDHEAAAQLHDERSEQDPNSAQAAHVHRELGKDIMSPMSRVADQMSQRGEVPSSQAPAGGRTDLEHGSGGVSGPSPQSMGIFSKPDNQDYSLASTPPGTGPGAPPALAAPKPMPQMSPFQNKPPVGLPSGADRQGPIPGMVQKPAPPQAAMTSMPNMPSSGSSTKQMEVLSAPPKNIGMNSPPTNPGSQQTAIQPSVVKPRPQTQQQQPPYDIESFMGLI